VGVRVKKVHMTELNRRCHCYRLLNGYLPGGLRKKVCVWGKGGCVVNYCLFV